MAHNTKVNTLQYKEANLKPMSDLRFEPTASGIGNRQSWVFWQTNNSPICGAVLMKELSLFSFTQYIKYIIRVNMSK